MSLQEKIKADYITAFKTKDPKKDTLKLMQAAFKQVEIDERKELTDEDILAILKSESKKRQDSIAAYTEGNRPDLVAVEQTELEIIQAYLPEQLSEEAIKEAVQKIITDTGANSAADFGKVMGAAMAQLKNQADGNLVQKAVKELLG